MCHINVCWNNRNHIIGHALSVKMRCWTVVMLIDSRRTHSEMIKMIHSLVTQGLLKKSNFIVFQVTALLEYFDISHASFVLITENI